MREQGCAANGQQWMRQPHGFALGHLFFHGVWPVKEKGSCAHEARGEMRSCPSCAARADACAVWSA
jgi:hypothetical protein